MLPSLLANDIQTALKQFLVSAFEPADAFNHGLMSRFVDDEAAWLKGPYVQVGLPFVAGKSGKTFFEAFETAHPGFSHQEHAWERLSSHRQGVSTLVATGTGSGKTECFLYPVLDHCARARAAGEAGVKALVIYPMNALATDQARRIAELVASTAAFAGLRVGLYVGGNAGAPGEGMVMTQGSVIIDRDILRKHPPDILLTNYKMLDYLMLRPKDRQLWAANVPTTLRYVVVDELHTFDGAQGTDLALLLRRLRARLKIPTGHLICAGTSATLGNAADTAPLREYARQIFGVPFGEEAVVTESRQSVGRFLEDATVDYMFLFRAEQAPLLEPSQYSTPQAAVQAWFSLCFPDEPAPEDVNAPAWRRELGQLLKRHQLFVNLLKLAKGGVVSYPELTEAFARNMPVASTAQVTQVLDALLVLVAWALRDGSQPLVTLRLQLWVRELRRMVGKLGVNPQEVKLRSERDLPVARDGVYLPMVQCSQCRTTGWLSRLVQGTSKLSTQLDEVYNTWFSRRPEAARLYASESISRSHVDGVTERVCVACGTMQQSQEECLACGHQELLSVFRVTAQKTQVIGQAQYTRHDNTCPACGEQDELLLLGARSATLGSQVVESSWASVFNDDKKLIELDKVRTKAQQKPQDEATRDEIDNLLRERDKLLELIKEINTRDLLNTLTDAGLLPNYAFPEAGVELKSVLWRKRASDEPGQGAYITLTTQKYERPAQSALSEFAPENRFYANQRRVEVDQINMNLAKTEDWRFCPSCHHMQNLTVEADTHVACPSCGDAMWSDAAQRRTLLRFKQAIANSNDTDVRIDDSADDREPKYYVRQLMADFSPSHIREAWQIGSGALPFGFEFISRVTFRDVNFGELAKPGEAFKVADKESSRPGFKLCKHCGKVQKPPRRSSDPSGQSHSFDCPKYGDDSPTNLLECLYLYREFESEALRILVPYTKNGMDESVVQSFMAAVQLGLKRRFGGKVDHLRMVLQDEPGKDGGPRRHYVMLYDSVPGGTGSSADT